MPGEAASRFRTPGTASLLPRVHALQYSIFLLLWGVGFGVWGKLSSEAGHCFTTADGRGFTVGCLWFRVWVLGFGFEAEVPMTRLHAPLVPKRSLQCKGLGFQVSG